MTKLSDTQCLILSAATQRDGNIALPLPTSLRGGAEKKVVSALLAKGYLAEAPASREPGTLVWDHDDEDNPITLIAAATGWQPHTIRGALAGALKKKLGLEVTSEKVEGRGRIYRTG